MPAEFDRLVKKIKAKGGARNPYAEARSVLGSDAEIKARRRSGRTSLEGRTRRRKHGGY